MQKGGYQIIDLSGHPFHINRNEGNTGSTTVPGIFKKIKSSTKALLFSGITIDDTSMLKYPTGVIRDMFLFNIIETPTDIQGTIYFVDEGGATIDTLTITIKNTDVVELKEMGTY